nr:DNA cytosine methyltransferase [Myxococcus sp. SDU36]
MSGVRVLDLFCGGGGSSYGALLAGCEVVAGVDAWDVASNTWRANFPRGKAICAKLEGEGVLPDVQSLGRIDLLLASPECTNHTCAKGAKPRSEDSKATAMQVLNYAGSLRPTWIVVENVVHMRSWARYPEFIEGLESLGYGVTPLVVDAADVGVPQSRRRLFLVCRLGEEPRIQLPIRDDQARVPVRRILDRKGTWDAQLLYKPGRAKATLERAERAMAALGKNERFLIVYYGTDGSGGWQSLDVPLRTITTLDRFGLVEPGTAGPTLRMLQVPELRRAMGFDEKFHMNQGSRRDRIKILGNGVCPPVMREIVHALLRESHRAWRPSQLAPGKLNSAVLG